MLLGFLVWDQNFNPYSSNGLELHVLSYYLLTWIKDVSIRLALVNQLKSK